MSTMASSRMFHSGFSSAPCSAQCSPSAAIEPFPVHNGVGEQEGFQDQQKSSKDPNFLNYYNITPKLEYGSVTNVVQRGGFGWIRRGRLRSGTPVAIKVLQPRDLTVSRIEDSKRFRNEIAIWSRLKHPNILPFLGIVNLSSNTETGLVSPWMASGNCNDYFKTHPLENRLPMILGVLSGLNYLHEMSTVHGDLRGGNILVSAFGMPLLCDFGLAVVVEDLTRTSVSTILQGSGNCRWMSSEVLLLGELPTKQSDVWAFGMVILELFTGKMPFQRLAIDAQVVLALDKGWRPDKPSGEAELVGFNDDVWNVIQSCWAERPESRPSTTELFPMLVTLMNASGLLGGAMSF